MSVYTVEGFVRDAVESRTSGTVMALDNLELTMLAADVDQRGAEMFGRRVTAKFAAALVKLRKDGTAEFSGVHMGYTKVRGS